MHTYAKLFGKAAKYLTNQRHAGNGPRTKKSEKELLMPKLVIGAWETESLIGNGFRPYGLGINMATKF